MIHIATTHWNSDRWIALQAARLRRHIKSDFKVYACLENISGNFNDSFHYIHPGPLKNHEVKLKALADVILSKAESDEDILIFIDGDAFPVGDIETWIRETLPTRKLMAVQRLENNGDPQPHPCFCVTTVGFWRQLKGDWERGYQWRGKNGVTATDVGGNLMKQLLDQGVDWFPIHRSNRVDLHPLFFGIYGGLIYHHGAGFRPGTSRADRAKRKINPLNQLLANIFPAYERMLKKRFVRKMISTNDALSQQVLESIQKDQEFFKQLM